VASLHELGDELGVVAARQILAYTQFIAGRVDDALAVSWQNLVTLRRLGGRRDRRDAIARMVACAFYGSMPAPEALRLIGEFIAGAETPSQRAEAERALPPLLAMIGRFDESRAAGARVLALFEEVGGGLGVALCYNYTGYALRLAGDLRTAERHLRSGMQVVEEMNQRGSVVAFYADLARVLWLQGMADEAEVYARKALEEADDLDFSVVCEARSVLARVRALAGSLDEAVELSRQAVRSGARTDYLDLRAMWATDLGEILAVAGHHEEGLRTLMSGVALFEQKGNLVMADRFRSAMIPR
jgi:tetratricopeptide (TPR) repeat protein